MVKRKQQAPKHADHAKRQCLQWNMSDGAGVSGIDSDKRSSSDAAETPPPKRALQQSGPSSWDSVLAVQVDSFYQNLANCTCTLTLNSHELDATKDKSDLLEFGKFRIQLVENQDTTPLPERLPAFNEAWLYLSVTEMHMLYFEIGDGVAKPETVRKRRKSNSRQTEFGVFWFVKLNVPTELLTDLGNRSFWLGCDEFNSSTKSLTITIYGADALILKQHHPSGSVRVKAPQLAIQKMMDYFYDVRLPYCPKQQERTTGHDFFQLYDNVMAIQVERFSKDPGWEDEVSRVQHHCLKPQLRPYQRQSVAWMLRQEHRGGNTQPGIDAELHPLYCKVTLPKDVHLYYNKYAGSFVREQPEATQPLPGGILADEMGLGKTVEVLCCMLLHPRPSVDQPELLPVIEDESSPPSSPPQDHNREEAKENSGDTTVERLDQSSESANTEKVNKVSENATGEQSKQILESSSSKESNKTLQGLTKESSNQSQGEYVTKDALDASETNTSVASEQPPSKDENESESNEISESISTDKKDATKHAIYHHLKSALPSFKDPHSVESLNVNRVDSPNSSKQENASPLSNSSTTNTTDSNSSKQENASPLSNSSTTNTTDSKIATTQNNTAVAISVSLNSSTNVSSTTTASPPVSSSTTVSTTPSASSCGENQSTTATATDTNNINSSTAPVTDPNSQSKKPKERRKSRKGYVEYVDDSAPVSNYFSIQTSGRQQWFECSCGLLEEDTNCGPSSNKHAVLHTVKCVQCGMSQHAECMNYDLRDPYRGQYLCPHCHAVCTTIKSGATLIISPFSICHQWIEEIKKHIKECSIKVFVYTGVSRLGYIQPQVLARQDIVITTYDVLRKELDYVNLPHTNSESGRRFRHPKRFLATPSPMVAVEWWRICLDEAQMVECVTTKTAEMALRLKAVNRWCVTGTPLMRSVEDIYGLLLFLNVDPVQVHQWFKQLLWEPFCHGYQAPMHHILSQVLWRTAKKDVIDQIDLPVQTEEINWLTFSPVEDHFYRRQYEVYLRSVYGYRQRVSHLQQDPSVKLHALDRKTMNELMSPLFRLRQACCHPQIVRGEFLPLNKAMMTMEELLEHMTKKVKIECEEAHRQIVASLNGMAGLAIIKDKIPEAVEKYREVLRSVELNKHQFRTDELQQLHAMHNLALLLERKPEGVAPTLRDGQLKEQCEELKTKYMARTKTNEAASLEGLEASQKNIKDLKMKLDSLDGDWWADVVDMTSQRSIDHDLIFKVKDDLLRTSNTEGTIADVFNTANGLLYVVDQHLQTLASARVALTDSLDQLWRDTTPGLVEAAATCCLRPAAEVLKTCLFCKVDELFNEYESKLFLFVERGLTVAGDEGNLAYQVSTKRQGTWADSEVERSLKSILAFYKQNFETDTDILEAAAAHIKYMDALKKEFKNLRSVWLAHREMISAIDELEMATERLRLRGEHEPKPTTKILNVIEATNMFSIQASCSSDEIVGRSELQRKLGQLLYLTNLAKRAEEGNNCNPDSCPICQCGLGVEWSVVMCGHCFCLGCMRTLIDRTLIGGNIDRRLKCPLCRFYTPLREISYVTTVKKDRVSVKGSHSTKIQAVVECLINIKQQDPSAKALVFSLWVSVLDILASALAENKITYKSLHDPNHFQTNLTSFKSDSDLSVLLLPLHVGANGLNLVEANHVLLVEPELNLEEEAQAISRVYRIGQTRSTKIHRFMVRGTIEEKIYHIVKSVRDSKTKGSLDGSDCPELTVGDITSLIQHPGPEEGEGDEEEEAVTSGGGRAENGDVVAGIIGGQSGGIAENSGTVQGDGESSSSRGVAVDGSGDNIRSGRAENVGVDSAADTIGGHNGAENTVLSSAGSSGEESAGVHGDGESSSSSNQGNTGPVDGSGDSSVSVADHVQGSENATSEGAGADCVSSCSNAENDAVNLGDGDRGSGCVSRSHEGADVGGDTVSHNTGVSVDVAGEVAVDRNVESHDGNTGSSSDRHNQGSGIGSTAISASQTETGEEGVDMPQQTGDACGQSRTASPSLATNSKLAGTL